MGEYKIDATLRYGKVYQNSIILYLWLSLSVLFLVLAFIVENSLQTYILIIIGAGSTILFSTLILIDFFVKRKMKKWMKDAIKLYASCFEKITALAPHGLYDPGKAIKISFVYNKKRIEKKSGSKFFTGRSRIFNKYVGKTINILYSPTYDEVMLLKE